MTTQPGTQQAVAGSNSTIIYPTVPKHEEDPAGRVNVMIAMFNNSLRRAGSNGPVDSGFAQEIATAQYILHNIVKDDFSVQCGWHISRQLTTRERAAGLKGTHSSLKSLRAHKLIVSWIWSSLTGDLALVVLPVYSPLSKQSHSEASTPLKSKNMGGKVMYSVDNLKHETALRAAYNRIPGASSLPPLEVILSRDETNSFGFVAEWNKRRRNILIPREFTRLNKWRFATLERPELWYAENTEEGTKYINMENEG